MPLSHSTKVFAVTDCKIYPITADPEGGTTTYGAAVDVPGIKSVAITGSIESKTLRGDNRLLDSDAVLGGVEVAIEHGKLSLDVLSVMLGGAVVDDGTTPSETATWGLTDASKPMPFKLEAKSASADPIAGDVHFVLYKVALASFPEMGLAEEDYRTHSVSGAAMPRLSDGKWIDTVIHETAADLSA